MDMLHAFDVPAERRRAQAQEKWPLVNVSDDVGGLVSQRRQVQPGRRPWRWFAARGWGRADFEDRRDEVPSRTGASRRPHGSGERYPTNVVCGRGMVARIGRSSASTYRPRLRAFIHRQ